MSIDLLSLLLRESGDGLSELKQSICTNIKMVLETHRSLQSVGEYPLVQEALYGYGLTVRHLRRSRYQGNRLSREIEQLLSRYEPRLRNVVVEMKQLNEQNNSLSFRIEGELIIGQATQRSAVPVLFDSVFNLTNASLEIEESSFA